MAKIKYIIGIDEVGRGALAGPVAVCAAALPKNIKIKSKIKLKDSKKLNLKQRIYWENWLKSKNSIFYSVSFVSNKVIDKINISNAANLAAFRSFEKLKEKLKSGTNFSVILDGGLYLKNKSDSIKIAKTIVKADEKFNAVKIASIIAKLNRDRLMVKAKKTWPLYGFDIHKGYGTEKHFDAIKKYGESEFHRLTFIQKKQ
jgi:ribonuclease HII